MRYNAEVIVEEMITEWSKSVDHPFVDPHCHECNKDIEGETIIESGHENTLLFCVSCYEKYKTEAREIKN